MIYCEQELKSMYMVKLVLVASYVSTFIVVKPPSDYAIGGFATIENDTIDGIIEFYLEKVGNNTVIMVDVDILGLEGM